ncbi:hypothetical protein DYB26_002921, partial [Aphanomyces astaci]
CHDFALGGVDFVSGLYSGLYYVQRRSSTKDYCPGLLEPMAGGVVGFGESYDESAYRELDEEMGIRNTPLTHITTFSYSSPPMLVWRSLYDCVYDGPVTKQDEEVAEVLLLSEQQILAREHDITPDGMFAFRTYLTSSRTTANAFGWSHGRSSLLRAHTCVARVFASPSRHVHCHSKQRVRNHLDLRGCGSPMLVGRGDFYVQRRTLIKDYCPGFLDPMAGGVVQAGESYEDNALREVKEEMGVSGVPLTFVCTFFYQDASTVVWGGMFECVYDGALTLQPEEVSQVLVMSASDIIARADEFTPDGLFAMRLYLEESNKATAAHPHA